MSIWFFILVPFATLAYALVAGVILAFSDFIMRSLAVTGGSGGVEAMQTNNREVFRWVFMTLFLGTAAWSLLLILVAAFGLSGTTGTMILLAGVVYLVGCFGVTLFFNVPMNEALAAMRLSSDQTRDYWLQTYVPKWTFWNSVRTVACASSAALLLFGLVSMIQQTTH